MTVNVVCMKWGTKFTAKDVNVLYKMVQRNLTLDHRFVCLTDDSDGIDEGVECLPLPDITVPPEYDYSPWRKLGMFSKEIGDLSGKTMFLDLDVIITDNIDCFFSHSDKFTIIENWTTPGRGIGNSSVYCFEVGAHADVLDYYNENMTEVLTSHDNEQIYLSKKIGDIDYWPAVWVKSFKRHCVPPRFIRYVVPPKMPEGVKIVVFHGDPKPEEAIDGGRYGNIFNYARPAPWVGEYWHL